MTDHAHELRRHARKIAHPAGDVPAVMLAAADEIERLQSVIAGLREACAKVCDEMSGSDYLPHQCAAAIRARGDA